MGKEITFNLSQATITKAEDLRQQGKNTDAACLSQPAIKFPIEDFNRLDHENKTRLLMAARIYVVSNTSSAKDQWKAPKVAKYLEEARRGIVIVYRNVDVQDALGTMGKDSMGNPYEFRTEMLRDEIGYAMVYAALTGNACIIDKAISKMDEIIKNSKDPSAKQLVSFTRDRILYRASKTPDKIYSYKNSYKHALSAAMQDGQAERAATISARFMIDGPGLAFVKGGIDYLRVVAKDKKNAVTLLREANQKLTEPARHKAWHRTAKEDYSYLVPPGYNS